MVYILTEIKVAIIKPKYIYAKTVLTPSWRPGVTECPDYLKKKTHIHVRTYEVVVRKIKTHLASQ